MNLKIVFGLCFWSLLMIIACNRDDISFSGPSQLLKFSKDTVFCDTVYSQTRSETYAVKVYNNENKDIIIPHIFLEKGNTSLYRINVDGKAGTDFTNVPLRKKDSLFIYVEIAPVATSTESIAEDKIQFVSPAGEQHVTLFSVVQDAEYFIQSATNPNVLSTNTTWTNAKAKIIFGDLTVATGKTLTIQAGTKVYFHKNSGLKIAQGSTLTVNGDLGSPVIFRGDRNDIKYDTIPLNWNSIDFDLNSNLNMNYGKIFGGTNGLKMNQTNATITNSIIHTFQNYGIYAVNSNVNASNIVMNNCGYSDFGIFKGGTYTITQCTLANFWRLNSELPGSVLTATNSWTNASGTTENGALNLNVKNSILYSNKNNAIFFNPISGQTFNYFLVNSLFNYGSNAGFSNTGNANISNSILNQDPLFMNYFTEKLNLRVKTNSPAKGKGNTTIAATVPLDLEKINRTVSPTIGAYQ